MDVFNGPPRVDRNRHRRENPSFSSILLDAIYSSIDEGNGEGEEQLIFYRETMRKKQSPGFNEEEQMANFRRACMIEKWMEKKVSEKVGVRRNSMADFDRKARNVRDRDFKSLYSSSSSSDSSYGGGFSSSESESFYGSRSRSSTHAVHRPKPIRTSAWTRSEPPPFEAVGKNGEAKFSVLGQKPKNENGFVKTKSRALKIYGELKKVKQPSSPGGRLASFLNSLFNGGTPKKPKLSTPINYQNERASQSKGSTCSSASSFSRSCLSKTPSSMGKLSSSDGSSHVRTKRSVRFCPVNEILEEDCRPCGHKSLIQKEEPALEPLTTLKNAVKFGDCHSEEVTKEFLKSYQKKKGGFGFLDHVQDGNQQSRLEDEEDEDAMSCSSSDLFELDNLSSIGIERYREELPVYETTHVDTNRAIANGLIL